MLLLYNTGIWLYTALVRIAALWNPKARQWLDGRRKLFKQLEKAIVPADRYIWMHCSSAGEFEQGKPVAEGLKKAYPGHKLLVSFYSPSGFNVAKRYEGADIICYLPVDTARNAERFLKIVKPELAVFVKYEFWYHFLSRASFHHVPVLLISATFRPNQIFFKSHGKFFRNILLHFRHVFVQELQSLELLQRSGIEQCSIGGDTRFDRVAAIVKQNQRIDKVEAFLGEGSCVIAGSTWPDDEQILKAFWEKNNTKLSKLVIAPHELSERHLNSLLALFPNAARYSSLLMESKKTLHNDVLIIDNVGMLSVLYQYGTLTYVGGGFTRDGIHNILEAAVWSRPVFFGPNHHKYREAGELIAAGGGFSVSNAADFQEKVTGLLGNSEQTRKVGKRAQDYVLSNRGATEKIVRFVQEKRLLTR